MSKQAAPVLVEVFSADRFTVYGLWRLTLAGGVIADVGCVVGVPEYQQGSARAAVSHRGYVSAWFGDSSDYGEDEVRNAALPVMKSFAVRLHESEALCAIREKSREED